MPAWLSIAVGVCALAAGVAGLWTKVLRPGARLITSTESMLPLLRDLTTSFAGAPGSFAVLREISNQFRTDSGSSLRDVLNRVEVGLNDVHAAADLLKVGVESDRQLAKMQAEALQRAIIMLDRLTVRVDAGSATSSRIEKQAAGVASDLAAAHDRADATAGAPGTAADAASQTAPRQT